MARTYKVEGILTDNFEDEKEVSIQLLLEEINESLSEWLAIIEVKRFKIKLTNLLRITNETSSNPTQPINNESTDSTIK